MSEPPPITDLQRALIDAIDTAMDERPFGYGRLARMAGITPKHLSQMLVGRSQGSFAVWQALLDVLGLRLTVGSDE